ncbi:hypothetical protein C7B80_25070 [Cyanosarcina cf. burmensis CCALA 770]|nr:hypothetical protein C7B80_25070 [Cyanosarcina cf. burmensis CCALA 770]
MKIFQNKVKNKQVSIRQKYKAAIFITCVLAGIVLSVAIPVPALAQVTAPQTSTIPCLGFYCPIANKLLLHPLFEPMTGPINAITTFISVVFAWLFIPKAVEAGRRGNDNEEWKSKAGEAFMILGIGSLLFVIAFGLVSIGGT